MPLPARAQMYIEAVQEALETTAKVPPLAPDIDQYVVCAVMDRETLCGTSADLTPPRGGPSATGDDGHGRGLMQIDDRPHPESYIDDAGLTNDQWIAQFPDDWKDPVKNITRATAQLRWGIATLLPSCPDPSYAVAASVAAYNAGIVHVKRILATLSERNSIDFVIRALDVVTSGRDYVEDVFSRVNTFRI